MIPDKNKLDLADDYKQFFTTFGLKYRPISRITLKQREGLELIWTTKYYEDVEIVDGKEYEIGGNYELLYCTDQWHGCSLCKLEKVNGHYYEKELYMGEGDSLTIALMALCIVAKDLMNDYDIEYLYDLFGKA